MKGSAHLGRVLQGYFGAEPLRGAGRTRIEASKAQPRPAAQRSVTPAPPRPDLLPAKMRARPAQPKLGRDGLWRGAPRPELLPGMGPVFSRGPGSGARMAQASSTLSRGVRVTPIPAGSLQWSGPGRPLEPGLRRQMEAQFGVDFASVRVHEGPAAQSIGALAFTLGEELHFAPGQYDPASPAGLKLISHELAHVVQQRKGRVRNPYGQGIVIVQDPALEAESAWVGQMAAEAAPPSTSRGFTGDIPDIVRGIIDGIQRRGHLRNMYNLAGGWEGWFQVEFALAAEQLGITREEPVYDGQRWLADAYKVSANVSVVVEIKCESIGQSDRFYERFKTDLGRLAGLYRKHGVFVAVVTNANYQGFVEWFEASLYTGTGGVFWDEGVDGGLRAFMVDGVTYKPQRRM